MWLNDEERAILESIRMGFEVLQEDLSETKSILKRMCDRFTNATPPIGSVHGVTDKDTQSAATMKERANDSASTDAKKAGKSDNSEDSVITKHTMAVDLAQRETQDSSSQSSVYEGMNQSEIIPIQSIVRSDVSNRIMVPNIHHSKNESGCLSWLFEGHGVILKESGLFKIGEVPVTKLIHNMIGYSVSECTNSAEVLSEGFSLDHPTTISDMDSSMVHIADKYEEDVTPYSWVKLDGWPPPVRVYHCKYNLPLLQVVVVDRNYMVVEPIGASLLPYGRILLHMDGWQVKFGFAYCDFSCGHSPHMVSRQSSVRHLLWHFLLQEWAGVVYFSMSKFYDDFFLIGNPDVDVAIAVSDIILTTDSNAAFTFRDLVQPRLQMQGPSYTGITGCLTNMTSQEGLYSLYALWGTNVLVKSVFSAVHLALQRDVIEIVVKLLLCLGQGIIYQNVGSTDEKIKPLSRMMSLAYRERQPPRDLFTDSDTMTRLQYSLKGCHTNYDCYSTVLRVVRLPREDEHLTSETVGVGYDSNGDDYSDGGNVLKLLGYISIMRFLPVYCFLGDYRTGIKCLFPIDNKQSRVIGSHITTNFQYERIIKKNEQMDGLLAIHIYLGPQRNLAAKAVNSLLNFSSLDTDSWNYWRKKSVQVVQNIGYSCMIHWEPGPLASQWQLDSYWQCSKGEHGLFFSVCLMLEIVSVTNGIAELVLVEHRLWWFDLFSCLVTQHYSVGDSLSMALLTRDNIVFFSVVNRVSWCLYTFMGGRAATVPILFLLRQSVNFRELLLMSPGTVESRVLILKFLTGQAFNLTLVDHLIADLSESYISVHSAMKNMKAISDHAVHCSYGASARPHTVSLKMVWQRLHHVNIQIVGDSPGQNNGYMSGTQVNFYAHEGQKEYREKHPHFILSFWTNQTTEKETSSDVMYIWCFDPGIKINHTILGGFIERFVDCPKNSKATWRLQAFGKRSFSSNHTLTGSIHSFTPSYCGAMFCVYMIMAIDIFSYSCNAVISHMTPLSFKKTTRTEFRIFLGVNQNGIGAAHKLDQICLQRMHDKNLLRWVCFDPGIQSTLSSFGEVVAGLYLRIQTQVFRSSVVWCVEFFIADYLLDDAHWFSWSLLMHFRYAMVDSRILWSIPNFLHVPKEGLQAPYSQFEDVSLLVTAWLLNRCYVWMKVIKSFESSDSSSTQTYSWQTIRDNDQAIGGVLVSAISLYGFVQSSAITTRCFDPPCNSRVAVKAANKPSAIILPDLPARASSSSNLIP